MPATLIVSAWEPEIAPLRRWLRTRAGRRHATAVALGTIGVGAVDAGIAAARLCVRARLRRLLFVGTAGAYAATPALDTAVVVTRATLVSTAVLRGDAYLPPPLVATVATDAVLVRAFARRIPTATAACPLAITKSTALAHRIAAATAATVENLELFSVARAAALAGVPFAAVVGISNRVAPRAHAEWKRHHEPASAAACAAVIAWLDAS